ncbi:hypothetical protein [Rahnella sp. RcJ3]|uniref:hypothetical protein n=1 Tax=Rahnella sp. RcJ3 TaxID=2292446 RepID=UPI001296D5B9|nr:hypothetical protein [Rahnella sp. RcJ3]MQB54638.1 hypothetical protein [Rahnella sp. RcJ3]
MATNIIGKNDISFDSEFVTSLIIGLENILSTEDFSDDENREFIDHLEKKVSAAKLASCLKSKFFESRVTPPIIINEWEKICTSMTEFEEIRNAWDNGIAQ